MQKRRFLFFISKTICRIKKYQIKKRCTSTRRAITYFILNFYAFRLFIDYRESIVQFKRRVPLFVLAIELRLSEIGTCYNNNIDKYGTNLIGEI